MSRKRRVVGETTSVTNLEHGLEVVKHQVANMVEIPLFKIQPVSLNLTNISDFINFFF
ncbi:hypothetical protein PtA15_3A41 [Puccinia triticina]|uniref:Uncharacterized protein n=1 Tax=Puccinia triticina TaxID=208348 RepID=A0ABY7CE86_9BASI|nr:uncharacterized protein PtA15_3A41 [Puccinia triticina]WAQ82678.1 hypothetical protein PtA15_3A41 [Puccinia triticina]